MGVPARDPLLYRYAEAEGQAYYEKMGFRTYRLGQVVVCKCLEVI